VASNPSSQRTKGLFPSVLSNERVYTKADYALAAAAVRKPSCNSCTVFLIDAHLIQRATMTRTKSLPSLAVTMNAYWTVMTVAVLMLVGFGPGNTGILIGVEAQLDFTINGSPNVTTNFTDPYSNVVKVAYSLNSYDADSYAQLFRTVSANNTCTGTSFTQATDSGYVVGSTPPPYRVTFSFNMSSLSAADGYGDGIIQLCHHVSSLKVGLTVYQRDTILNITYNTTSAYSSAGNASGVNGTVAVVSTTVDTSTFLQITGPGASIMAGQKFTLSIASIARNFAVSTINSNVDVIVNGAVESSWAYLAVPSCGAGTCSVTVNLPWSYFQASQTYNMGGTVLLSVSRRDYRRRQLLLSGEAGESSSSSNGNAERRLISDEEEDAARAEEPFSYQFTVRPGQQHASDGPDNALAFSAAAGRRRACGSIVRLVVSGLGTVGATSLFF
jgi:hypothetical protein